MIMSRGHEQLQAGSTGREIETAPVAAVRCSVCCGSVHGHCGCARNLLEGRAQIRPRVRLEVASIADLGAEKKSNDSAQREEMQEQKQSS